ncbi:hypothetical protein DPMN_110813 [Dreissena polymorpha]|uniref:Uncharacterized protein n=1 Tax=Dreissena polymorpha TaxID=45954 RepID=A0A9D4KDI0_DREPO|nr:hypothetical protein DPMN_110813 [Dreissena polymorpha]
MVGAADLIPVDSRYKQQSQKHAKPEALGVSPSSSACEFGWWSTYGRVDISPDALGFPRSTRQLHLCQ